MHTHNIPAGLAENDPAPPLLLPLPGLGDKEPDLLLFDLGEPGIVLLFLPLPDLGDPGGPPPTLLPPVAVDEPDDDEEADFLKDFGDLGGFGDEAFVEAAGEEESGEGFLAAVVAVVVAETASMCVPPTLPAAVTAVDVDTVLLVPVGEAALAVVAAPWPALP